MTFKPNHRLKFPLPFITFKWLHIRMRAEVTPNLSSLCKRFPQTSKENFHTLSWTWLTWRLTLLLYVKLLLHWEHGNFSCVVLWWFFMWSFSPAEVRNCFPHSLHRNGFSFKCRLMWPSNWARKANVCPQSLQMWGRSFPWWKRICARIE